MVRLRKFEMTSEPEADITQWDSLDIVKKLNEPGGNSEETVRLYTLLANRNGYLPNYKEVYLGPAAVAERLATLIPHNRGDVRIIDIGAGTGFLSELLRNYGFDNIDGLDPVDAMLARAKEHNLYKNYICAFVTENPLNINEGTYDAVVMCGAFVGGHMPCVALREMVRVLKKGGFCCFNIREEYLQTVEEYKKLEDFIAQLEKEGKWEKIERRTYPNHFFDKSGILYSYKKL